ncbi:MAG: tRNA (adenosine(37)-N6)-threonylcarbamoyltransferase complex ATPase subunit type 1 TsaE [Eubacterium sp.]|nr:tRNA (adenosine(37)-N6)-threonylcarbamoyltransferase complex ATPase subunit type 1 TsaE [Eubacterium sp.]
MSEEIIESAGEADTLALGERLGRSASPGDIYLLDGDLGVGKTVFAKGFARGLDIKDTIVSPTFTIVHEYDGRLRLFHFDVYRIGDPDEMYDIGFDEYLYGDGVCLIEWPERVAELIPDTAVRISIEKDNERGFDYRRIRIAAAGGERHI